MSILCFPYSNKEEFKNHDYYKSIEKVNISEFLMLLGSTNLIKEHLYKILNESNIESKSKLPTHEAEDYYYKFKNTKPIIDFLNAAYNDNISYEARLYYDDKEISNFDKKSSRYISFYADMYIKVIDKDKSYEYEIEFQTVYENNVLIKMFRYSFEML